MEKEEFKPESEKYSRELLTAVNTAKNAGKIILEKASNKTSERKGLEFKSTVDMLANQAIIENLTANFPTYSVISEESEIPKRIAERTWIIDPLDGTTNFLNGSRNYSVLIGLIENEKLALGVCYLPATDELFHATSGEGAYLNGKRIHVSDVSEIKQASVVLDSGYDEQGPEKIADLFPKLRKEVGNIAMYNANGYTLSMLAKGELAGFYHMSSKIWEASGFLLVKEAGGLITTEQGRDLDLNFLSQDGFRFLASNGRIHMSLVNVIQS